MIKTLFIEGMSCGHCVKRVEKSLGEVAGVKSVTVDLKAKNATVELNNEVDNATLIAAVDDAGYDVVKVEE